MEVNTVSKTSIKTDGEEISGHRNFGDEVFRAYWQVSKDHKVKLGM